MKFERVCTKQLSKVYINPGNAEGVMERRKEVYRSAIALHLQRFNRGIRNWKLPDIVALNPISENKASVKDII